MFFNEVFISPDTITVWFWMVVFLSVFCGGAIGYFAMIIPKYGKHLYCLCLFLGFMILGASLGVVIALVLDELLFAKIP
jgi:uncharacterized membrane protein